MELVLFSATLAVKSKILSWIHLEGRPWLGRCQRVIIIITNLCNQVGNRAPARDLHRWAPLAPLFLKIKIHFCRITTSNGLQGLPKSSLCLTSVRTVFIIGFHSFSSSVFFCFYCTILSVLGCLSLLLCNDCTFLMFSAKSEKLVSSTLFFLAHSSTNF